jgi:hypothetical protein
MGFRGGFVGSPIEQESAEKMSDRQWLGALAKYDSEERGHDFDDPTRGGALELARMLEKFTKEEPERFANLALQFPQSTHPYYFSHVLRGLAESEIEFDLKLAVARRLFSEDHRDCIQSVLKILGSAPGADLAEDAVDFIQRTAENPDPETDDGGFGCILTNGINSVRGYVAEAIRSLIFEDAHYLTVFTGEIRRLVNDPTLAVRSVAASTLHPVINHDRSLALQWFSDLVNTDDQILGVRFVQDFVQYSLWRSYNEVSPVIERMLSSQLAEVRNKGGTLAGLARLYHAEEAEALCKSALAGDESSRLGVAEVAKSNLLNPDCREWCELLLSGMFHDEKEGVRKLAANCFWHLWQSPETPLRSYNTLMRTFVSSPAFADEPTLILYALSETESKVPDAALDVCEAFITRCGEQARDMRTSYAADEHIMGKLVFSTIAQLNEESQQIRALNVIDLMSLEGLPSVGGHLAEVER